MKSLKDKVIIITGASRGIGANVAIKLADEGATVVVNFSSNEIAANEVVMNIKKNGGTAIAIKADVSKEEEVKKMFDETIKAFGCVNVLINNAGIMTTKYLKDNTEDDFDKQFNINVKGTFFSLKEASTKLADNGIIINLSSSTVKMMLPTYAIYSATKAAVEQMTRVFSKEIGRGVSVNSIAPGPTATKLFLNGKSEELVARLASLNAFNRIAQPEDITNIILFLASDDSKWISGQIIYANGAMV
jgi:3-oxoacyl-[acyl-carrier protein] reductase